MSRTNDVNIAMQYAKSGVDGVHLMDSHKATIGWVVNTLAAEVERLEKRENELINALDMGQINCDAIYAERREVAKLLASYFCSADWGLATNSPALNSLRARLDELGGGK